MYITLKQHYIEYYHLFNADKKSKKKYLFSTHHNSIAY